VARSPVLHAKWSAVQPSKSFEVTSTPGWQEPCHIDCALDDRALNKLVLFHVSFSGYITLHGFTCIYKGLRSDVNRVSIIHRDCFPDFTPSAMDSAIADNHQGSGARLFITSKEGSRLPWNNHHTHDMDCAVVKMRVE